MKDNNTSSTLLLSKYKKNKISYFILAIICLFLSFSTEQSNIIFIMLSIIFFCLCIKNNNRVNKFLYEKHKNKSNKTYTAIEATYQSTEQLNKLDNNKDKINAITKDLTSIENKQDVYKIKKDKEFEELLNSLIEISV